MNLASKCDFLGLLATCSTWCLISLLFLLENFVADDKEIDTSNLEQSIKSTTY